MEWTKEKEEKIEKYEDYALFTITGIVLALFAIGLLAEIFDIV